MNLLKIFLLNLIIIQININVYSATIKYFSSNSNGLELLKITPSNTNKYQYILKITYTEKIPIKKILYKNSKEFKRWEYYYNNGLLYHEKYYKDKQIKETYNYDSAGHKIKQIEYKNNEKIKETTYQYNKDGLVDIEKIYNPMNKTTITVKYRYDRNFRIKQIEKKYPDGRLVFWESFFTTKGIILKEYYTLKSEKFTFWYNENGQEMKGEVTEIKDDNTEELKKEWVTSYKENGRILKKEENDYVRNKKTITWYNDNYKEKKVETYIKNELSSIDRYDYTKTNKISFHERIEDLDSIKTYYEYSKDDKLIRSMHYNNDELKKIVIYNEDESKKEILYGENNRKIIIEYDKKGNIISQETYETENTE